METTMEYNEVLNILQLLIDGGTEAFPEVMAKIYNIAMKLERAHHLHADPYERSSERNGMANGFKSKKYKTQYGELNLQIPQVRDSETPFYPQSLERGERSSRSLLMAAAEMYIKGVSTRKVKSVFQELCGMDVSAEQVTRATKELDVELEKWRNRELGEVKVIYLDATYHKARVDGVVVSVATFIATGIYADGHRAIIGIDAGISENEIHWRKFLESLKARKVTGTKLIVSDDHPGLKAALAATFNSVGWQRCQTHLQRNAQAYARKHEDRSEIASCIRGIFRAPSLEESQRLLEKAIEKYEKSNSKLAAWMADNIQEGFTVFRFPENTWTRLRTNN